MYRQVLYHSRATREMSTQDLRDLLAQARDLNQAHGITGLLFYVELHFMQCIEGAAADIGQLVDNIRADDRNTAFDILFDRDIPTRAFPGWSMGWRAFDIDDLRGEPGFHDIRNADDLDALATAGNVAFDLMRSFYTANAGRSF
ncbi:MAG: BLUF domain-containing protein [Rhodospirillales bacterium]|tara:strand:- start:212 stop:643 length:432 start_codon:yes stop_codon:yes gene_type:complete